MKAITIYDPWATLIKLKEKKYETRSWATKYRGQIWIHAAVTTRYADLGFQAPFFTALKPIHSDVNGHTGLEFYPACIIAVATLTDCVEITPEFIKTLSEKELAFGDYTIGRYAWELDNVVPLEQPIPMKGKQRIWNWGGM